VILGFTTSRPDGKLGTMRTKLTVLALLAPFALASPAFGLAGGSTGSGGGGGGGFSGGGGSSGGGYYGGSGGGGEWDTASTIIFLAIMFLVFGVPFIFGLFNKSRRQWYTGHILKRDREVSAAAGAAHLDDGYWDPGELRKRVREAFFPIQMSWENRDVSASRPFVSDALFERHRLQLEGYEKQNRVNRIADLKLSQIYLVRLYNVTDDGQDRFVTMIECSARDWMEDTRTGAMINGNKTSATEFKQYWTFVRHPQYGWVLDEIQQGEEAEYHLTAPIVNQDEGPRIYEQQEAGPPAPPSPPAPATS
jgi:Tim44-like domain